MSAPPPDAGPAAPDARRRGLRMVAAAGIGLAVFALAAVGWIAAEALRNPDVRARRPGWVTDGAAFDAAFWGPLLATVVVGVALVAAVLVRAARRLAAGEDLYAGRYGRGLRRRGEGADEP